MFSNIKYILINSLSLNKKAMKKILFIACVFISMNTNAQYVNNKGWKSAELIVPVATIGLTFGINDYRMNNEIGSQKQTAIIAAVGIAISLATHFIFKKIRKNKNKRNFNFKHR
jgi:hypothetical protein